MVLVSKGQRTENLLLLCIWDYFIGSVGLFYCQDAGGNRLTRSIGPPVERLPFGLVAWCNSNKKSSLAHKCRAACSEAVMLHTWYAIAFRFNSHLGNFPFFQKFRVSVRVAVRVSILGLVLCLLLDLVLGLGFIFYVYFVSAKPVAATILVAKQTLPTLCYGPQAKK